MLDQAISWVDEHSDMIATDKREAIWCRLLFRQQFLDALCHDVGFLDSRSTDKFGPCVSTLPLLAESSSLGQLVEAACSLKIQRKLASTVPPRPMVKISFDKAITHLRRLCQDAVDLQDALCYRGADNLKVCRLISQTYNAYSKLGSDGSIRWPSGRWRPENLRHLCIFEPCFRRSSSTICEYLDGFRSNASCMMI